MAARWFRYGMVAMLLLAGGGIPPLAAQDDPEVAEEEPATLLAAAGAGNMARVRALLEAGAAVAVVAAACDRAVRGDYSGAVADFQAVLASEWDSRVRAERVAWVAALERGENPLSPGVLEGRRYPWLAQGERDPHRPRTGV